MKNTMKKALAFLLTLALAVPMFAVAANAKIVTETKTVSISENFDTPVVPAANFPYSFKTASGWTGMSETTDIGGLFVGDDGTFKYLCSTTALSRYQVIAPESVRGSENYTITGEVKVNGFNKWYYRVFLAPDANKAGDNNICLHAQGGDNFFTYVNGDAATVATNLSKADTIGFKCVRSGNDFTVTFFPKAEGIESANAVTCRKDVSAVADGVVPCVRIQAGGASDVDTYAVLDNLKIEYSYEEATFVPETDIVPEGWTAVAEDFADADSQFTLKHETADGVAKIADGKLVYTLQTNAQDNIAAPETFAADVFTFSGEMNIESAIKATSAYTRIHFRPFKDAFAYAAILHLTQDANSSYIQFLNDQGVPTGDKFTGLAKYIGTDVQYQLTRYGHQMAFSIWVKGQYDTTVQTITYEIDKAEYQEKLGTPQIRFQTPNNSYVTTATTITMDNLYLENTIGKINVVGAQASVGFIATIDSRDYLKAGFAIKATTADNTVKEWSLDTCTAYDSIIANDAAGTAKYTAQDLGGKYLIAVTIDNIPKSVGSVSFDLSAFCGDAANTFTSGIVDVVATVNADGTVTLA